MRLLVCGSRDWTDRETIARELLLLRPAVLLHGAAPGADGIAAIAALEWARACDRSISVIPFPADWSSYGSAAGPKRNQRMVNAKPDLGLAFGPLWRAPGRVTGTGDCVRRMLRAGIPVRWVAAPGGEAVELREMPAAPAGGE